MDRKIDEAKLCAAVKYSGRECDKEALNERRSVATSAAVPAMRGKISFIQLPLPVVQQPNCAKSLDQYYTLPVIAQMLYRAFLELYDPNAFWMVDPSAGKGAFFNLLPEGSAGIDRDPKCPGLLQADYLTLGLSSNYPICVIGNPPYGQNASLAKRFFNHAADHAQVIAFVLPKSFGKASVVNKLNPHFRLVSELDLPREAFIFESKPRSVPTVFQIWERCTNQREVNQDATQHPDFQFTTSDRADFAIQRVGARAGRIHHDFSMSASSHYFIRGEVEHVMRKINFAEVTRNVAGNPSLAKREIVKLYKKCVEGETNIENHR